MRTPDCPDRSIPAPVLSDALAKADADFVADFTKLIAAPCLDVPQPWPDEAVVRVGTAIAGMPMRPVPGRRAVSAGRMPQPELARRQGLAR